MNYPLGVLLLAISGVTAAFAQDEKIYSGPQIGEEIPAFAMKYGFGDQAGSDVDLVEMAGDQPLVLVFVHERSRPAFGLANAIMKYCSQDGGDRLVHGICYLTDDPNEAQDWLESIQNYFPKNVPVGFSMEGVEGPGDFGLNRNVQLTIIIGKEKKVTANFALIEPSSFADGPKILQQIAAVTGSDKQPDINLYLPSRRRPDSAGLEVDPRLVKNLRLLFDKNQSTESKDEAIQTIQQLVEDNAELQNQLGSAIAARMSDRLLESLDEEHAAIVKTWASQFAGRTQMQQNNNEDQRNTPLANLLRSVIQKSATDEEVETAAKAVEEYIDQHPQATAEIGRITNRIVNSGKLSNYGTARAQQILKEWAEKFKPD